MDDGLGTSPWLVEHYAPGAGVETLEEWLTAFRAGLDWQESAQPPIRIVGAWILPEDETVLLEVLAPSETAIERVSAQAGIHIDRISAAIHASGPDRAVRPAATSHRRSIHGRSS